MGKGLAENKLPISVARILSVTNSAGRAGALCFNAQPSHPTENSSHHPFPLLTHFYPHLSWKLGKGFQFFIALRKNAVAGKVGKNTFLGFSGYFSPWWSLARLSSQILTAGIKEISTKVYSVVY